MSKEMNFKIVSAEVTITPENYRTVSLDIKGVDSDDILGQFDIDTVIQFFTIDSLLEKIGEDECKEYFDLTEKNDE